MTTSPVTTSQRARDLCKQLGVPDSAFAAQGIQARSPIDGSNTATVRVLSPAEASAAIERAHAALEAWKVVPAPKRGELIRIFGEVLRANKAPLGQLVTLEAGKIVSEGLGEVQEMIDICDFAVGLSRQLYGKTIASERFGHRMMETWHPLGVCGIISAFNFPVAVWAWNAALAVVCGDPVVWKPSEKTPLTALATHALFEKAIAAYNAQTSDTKLKAPAGLAELLMGDASIGQVLVDSHKVPLISATGSTRMGSIVGPRVAARFGRSILELGGNNGMIVAPSADLDLAVRAICFSAVGTAGQRCTTLRRLFAHESVAAGLIERVKNAYASLPIGSPLANGTLIGPLVDEQAYNAMQAALADAKAQGGKVFGGERVTVAGAEGGFYVRPAIVEMPAQTACVERETFAPILYVMTYKELPEAIKMHNAVPQGLASCIFTTDVREAETFVSAAGSDCGIVNVNIGPSGAEIGGAFGGEKETGGGRESGSDSWKAYMRRATNTVNYSKELPLAQGVQFL
jgi:aldehyde dehydrogenase (NAD+)